MQQYNIIIYYFGDPFQLSHYKTYIFRGKSCQLYKRHYVHTCFFLFTSHLRSLQFKNGPCDHAAPLLEMGHAHDINCMMSYSKLPS